MRQIRPIFRIPESLTGCISLEPDIIKLYFKEESYGSY